MAASERKLMAIGLLCSVAGFGLLDWKLSGLEVDVAPVRPPAVAAAQPGGPSLAAGAGAAALSLDALPETLARPLFSKTRRPAAARLAGTTEVPAPIEQAPVAPEGLRLVGFMSSKERGPQALIRGGSDVPGNWVKVGEAVAGWTLSRIEKDRVVLESGGATAELVLNPTNPTREGTRKDN